MDADLKPSNPIAQTFKVPAVKDFWKAVLPDLKGLYKLPDDIEPNDEIEVKGYRNSSDIKWNAMTGYFRILPSAAMKKYGINEVFYVEIRAFTGNCGIKAISHFRVAKEWGAKSDIQDKVFKAAMPLLNDFLWNKTNCNMVIGSDYTGGQTFGLIKRSGDFEFTDETYNRNYGQSNTSHRIRAFWRILDKSEGKNNYFNAESW